MAGYSPFVPIEIEEAFKHITAYPAEVSGEYKVYLAGPMTGFPNFNRDYFFQVEEDCLKAILSCTIQLVVRNFGALLK